VSDAPWWAVGLVASGATVREYSPAGIHEGLLERRRRVIGLGHDVLQVDGYRVQILVTELPRRVRRHLGHLGRRAAVRVATGLEVFDDVVDAP
jgi:hypothetical protein